MAAPRMPDPAKTRESVAALADWLHGTAASQPDRALVAEAVRLTARTLAGTAPGGSVEVRIPPFVAVQCIPGLRHTRGTPPNVVETEPLTWLRLATGLLTVEAARADGSVQLSGSRAAEIADWLPVVPL